MVLEAWQNGGGVNGGNAALQNPNFVQLCLQGKLPHFTTCMNWIKIHQLKGYVRPKRATGNFFSEREINGFDLFNLTLFCLICLILFNLSLTTRESFILNYYSQPCDRFHLQRLIFLNLLHLHFVRLLVSICFLSPTVFNVDFIKFLNWFLLWSL